MRNLTEYDENETYTVKILIPTEEVTHIYQGINMSKNDFN